MLESINNVCKLCSSIDFSFLELVLSTFFGFISALLVESIFDRYKETKDREQLLKNLKLELTLLKENVETLDPNKVYIKPYSIPIWTGAKECGSLICLDKSKAFYKILEVYSSIEEANKIELKCFEMYINKTPSMGVLIKTTLVDNRRNVKKQIEKVLNLLDGLED